MAESMPPGPDPEHHPRRNSDDVLADALRREGLDEIDVAAALTAPIIVVSQWVTAGRVKDPEAFPGYVGDTDAVAVARKILGCLLDIGWTPPAVRA